MKKGYSFGLVSIVALAGVIAILSVSLVSANTSAIIDFENGLAAGDIVSSLDCTTGVTCSNTIAGSVAVEGTNPNPAVVSNAAMIFDSDCVGAGCTGGDDDLSFPGHGNTLIISRDLDSTDPDDADLLGALFEFDFSGFGPGKVDINSIDVGDIEVPEGEDGAFLEAFENGCGGDSLGVTSFPPTGDNVIETVDVNTSGVDCIRVVLNGSGVIDNIDITLPLPALARITGGGWRSVGTNGESVRSSQGLTLHCDILLSNNLQINWDNGQKWHIDKVVDAAFCKDDPNFTPEPPVAPADTYIGVDVGKLNNSDAATACFIFEDHGEVSGDPDGEDRALIRIWEPGTAPAISDFDLAGDDPCMVVSDPPNGNTVLFVPLVDIDGGNLQFHFDQPHGNNK